MGAYLQLRLPAGQKLWPLEGSRLEVGRHEANGLVLGDTSVSRMHAVLEHHPAGWIIRDLDSRNGTLVNQKRLVVERPLRSGDEIQFGNVTAIFVDSGGDSGLAATAGRQPPPYLTRREQEVLDTLCRLSSGQHFRGPATSKEIGAELSVTDGAIKQTLTRLYDKFEIVDGPNRRGRLADEALGRGAVSQRGRHAGREL
jgi:predicted component of type VI protein secretion system